MIQFDSDNIPHELLLVKMAVHEALSIRDKEEYGFRLFGPGFPEATVNLMIVAAYKMGVRHAQREPLQVQKEIIDAIITHLIEMRKQK